MQPGWEKAVLQKTTEEQDSADCIPRAAFCKAITYMQLFSICCTISVSMTTSLWKASLVTKRNRIHGQVTPILWEAGMGLCWDYFQQYKGSTGVAQPNQSIEVSQSLDGSYFEICPGTCCWDADRDSSKAGVLGNQQTYPNLHGTSSANRKLPRKMKSCSILSLIFSTSQSPETPTRDMLCIWTAKSGQVNKGFGALCYSRETESKIGLSCDVEVLRGVKKSLFFPRIHIYQA